MVSDIGRMKRAIAFAAIGTLVVMAAVFGAGPIQRRFNELRSDQALIRGDTGDVMATATYQRFQAQREAVARMQADLRLVARAESAYMADSGRPTVNLPAAYWRGPSTGNVGPFLRIERDGFRAMMMHTRTTMRCVIVARFDTLSNTYHPGAADCRTESGEAWDAIVATEAASRPPAPAMPEAPPAPPSSPPKHLDWGPVNNTPPRMPFIRKETCEGEGCTISGAWAACSTVVALADKRPDAASVFTIHPRERFTALTADLHVLEPGIVVFRRAFRTTIPIDEAGLVDITFTPADTLFVLYDLGEGHFVWRYRGSTMRAEVFWDPYGPPASSDSLGLVRPAKTVWWVRVRNAAGEEGWIVGDYSKMATGGYMDEVERCLHDP
jgi:hypothetical protein